MNEQPLKLYIFYCSTGLDADELFRSFPKPDNDTLKFIGLPCSGKADVLYLLKAFETGADGVALITCREGECRYLEGNLRAVKRADAVNALLEEIGLGKNRMTVIQLTEKGIEQVIRELEIFIDAVRRLRRPDSSRGNNEFAMKLTGNNNR